MEGYLLWGDGEVTWHEGLLTMGYGDLALRVIDCGVLVW